MSTVIVKENETLDSAIRRWKKKCANDGIIGDLRRKEAYEKPSVRRKRRPMDVVFFIRDSPCERV